MSSPLATDRHGNTLVSVNVATTEQLEEAAKRTPCPLALVVLEDGSTGQVLFGLNRWRQEYELPGGMVEDGEAFADTARRELEEETAIRLDSLDLVGYAHYTLVEPDREELGAVYLARVRGEQPRPTEELQAFVWRKPLSASELTLSTLDDAVAAWATAPKA